jgi:hypothetical protein
MADEMKPALESFTCPHCKYQFPKSHVRLLTRRTRYRCDNCSTVLSPVLEGVKITQAIPGVLFSITTIALLILLTPIIGVTAVVCVLILFHTVGIWLSVKFFNKHVHLVEADPTLRAGLSQGTILKPLFHRHEKTLPSSNVSDPLLESFMCPHCRHKFPARKALLLTRWTRYVCPKCNSRLSPVVREIEVAGMISGILGFAGSAIILETVTPIIGFGGGIVGILIYTIFLVAVGSFFCNKYVHLEIVNK